MTNLPSVPQHVAIIMDGNGRWAQKRGLPRLAGHRQGAEAVERIVRAAADRGVAYLTLFAFSTENWQRPIEEVSGLMTILLHYLRSKTADMHRNNVCLKIIGDRSRLGKDVLAAIDAAESLTNANTGITVVVALSYSGRWDMLQAAQKLAIQVAQGDLLPDGITQEKIAANLSTAGLPDPDLIIRTSGERRVSNFLLWQGAYSEYVFTDLHWPDFDTVALDAALHDYTERNRRFGGLQARAS